MLLYFSNSFVDMVGFGGCVLFLKCPYILRKVKKNGDAPGPLGDFVMWLVTERPKTKEKQTNQKKEKKENLIKFYNRCQHLFYGENSFKNPPKHKL